MGKLRIFLNRLQSGSASKMMRLAGVVHQDTGAPVPFVLGDMIQSYLQYGIGYQEYTSYGFYGKPSALRKTFMNMEDNIALTKYLDDPEAEKILNDKARFMSAYAPYVGRDWIDLRQSGPEELERFMQCHAAVMAKPVDQFGGLGITKLNREEIHDYPQTWKRLRDGGAYLIEAYIVQDPQMSKLNPHSVNTMRMVTVVRQGQARIVYTILRMGKGNTAVDNATSGGIYTRVPDDGVLCYPAYSEKEGLYFDQHPYTGTTFKGFRIPCFEKARNMVIAAARQNPNLGYVGWDVAISDHGPVLIEGNDLPGYDMIQNKRWQIDGKGIKPDFEQMLGCSFQQIRNNKGFTAK